jgi:hypothetical protein
MLKGNRTSLRLLTMHATPLVLMLMVHSVVVSGFHHHSTLQTPIVNQGSSIEADDTDRPGESPAGGGDSSCVSCQLQRTFASEVQTPSVLPFVPAEPVRKLLVAALPMLGPQTMVLSNRAPPSA